MEITKSVPIVLQGSALHTELLSLFLLRYNVIVERKGDYVTYELYPKNGTIQNDEHLRT